MDCQGQTEKAITKLWVIYCAHDNSRLLYSLGIADLHHMLFTGTVCFIFKVKSVHVHRDLSLRNSNIETCTIFLYFWMFYSMSIILVTGGNKACTSYVIHIIACNYHENGNKKLLMVTSQQCVYGWS